MLSDVKRYKSDLVYRCDYTRGDETPNTEMLNKIISLCNNISYFPELIRRYVRIDIHNTWCVNYIAPRLIINPYR